MDLAHLRPPDDDQFGPAPSPAYPTSRSKAGADPVIQGLRHGYDTMLGKWFEKAGTLTFAPLSASGVRTSVPYSAIDPATEFVAGAARASSPRVGDGTQVWRITHDGIESHSIHFGSFNVQVLARTTRDGDARAPDPGELGWKDTLRIDPLESCLIALRPVLPRLPFKLDASERPLDVTRPLGAIGGFTDLDPLTADPDSVTNESADFSWEASWGIHLPGGEENHVTRPLMIQGSPGTPEGLTASAGEGRPSLSCITVVRAAATASHRRALAGAMLPS